MNQSFNKYQDEIAVTIPYFEMRKSGDIFGGLSEPYIISIAVSESALKDPNANLQLNNFYFPNIQKCLRVNFGGVGRIIYGPQNPGKFVTYNVLFMESDKDVREAGNNLDQFMRSPEIGAISKALALANPTYGAVAEVVRQIGSLVGKFMKKNKDDELFRLEGALLRDTDPPYNIGDTYESFNKYIACPIHILPIYQSSAESEVASRGLEAPSLHTFGKLPRTIPLF